jgi:hypothetical protein
MPFAVIALGVMAATWWGSLAVCHWLLADGCWLLAVGSWQLAILLAMRIVMAVVLYYVVMRLLRVKILEECMNFLRKK